MFKYKLSKYNVIHQTDIIHYYWNTYSGALIALDKDSQNYISSFSGFDDGSNEFNLLKNNGFIVFDQFDELGRVRFQEKRALFSRYSDEMRFVIALGLGCNYTCWYCFENEKKSPIMMTSDIATDVANYINQQLLKNPMVKKLRISWFGGEPLLYKDTIKLISEKIIKINDESHIPFHTESMVFTNGYLLNAITLNDLQKVGVNKAQITLDGMSENYAKNKGASSEDFNTVISNICNAADKIDLIVRLNIPDAEEAISISNYLLEDKNLSGKIKLILAFVRDYSLSSEKAKCAFINYVDNHSKWIKYIYKNYGVESLHQAESPRRMNSSCGQICSNNVTIGPQGEFYRCDQSLGDEKMVVGNIWQGRFFNEIELMHYKTIEMYNDCSECNYLPVCMGGCVMHRIKNYGGFDCTAYKRWRLNQKLLEGGVYI